MKSLIKAVSFIGIISLLHLLPGCSNDDNKNDGGKTVVPAVPAGDGADKMLIYEVNPKLFTRGQALSQISSRLDELDEMGVDVVWLMPIYPEGTLNAFGSPYCVKDYLAVNTNYGSFDDLKTLVSKAHSLGMKVILDWVANHTAWDNEWIENKDWYTQDGSGNIISPAGTTWTDVADLNYNSSEMRAAMYDAMEYWVVNADVDGFRCDYAEGVPTDFWVSTISSLRKVKSGLVMLAEGSQASLSGLGFDVVYAWNFPYTLEKVFKGTSTPSALLDQYESEQSGMASGSRRMRYTTNHDMASEESPVTTYGSKEGAFAAWVIASLMTDTPMLYSSQEIGYSSALSFMSTNVLDWDSAPDYTQLYKDYIKVYESSAWLREGDPIVYSTTDSFAVSYENGTTGLFAMVNFSGKVVAARVPMAMRNLNVRNLVTSEESTLSTTVGLDPYGYVLFELL